MGTLITIGIMAILLIVCVVVSSRWDFWGGAATIGNIVFTIALVIFVIGFICNRVDSLSIRNDYIQDSCYIGSVYNNKNLSSTEREKAIDGVMRWNKKISQTHKMRKHMIFDGFYIYEVGDYSLFDIAKIPEAKFNVGINANITGK